MNDFCFANYYKIMKENSLNASINDVVFMYDIFSIINIKHFAMPELQKGTVSRILNRSLGVPSSIKEMLLTPNLKEIIGKSLMDFIEKYYSQNVLDTLWSRLKELIFRDKYLSTDGINNILNNNCFISFMADVYIEAIRIPNKLVGVKKIIARNGKTEISYDFNDIFEISKKKKKIIVIPMDVNFELRIESPVDEFFPLVDEATLHGKWISMMLSNGFSQKDLKKMIVKGIIGPKEIGNISIVPYDNNIYYLVSLSEFDNHNVARSSTNALINVLNRILELYILNGQSYELIIPLLGTGKSKIGYNHSTAFSILCKFFSENISKIFGKVRIVIYYSDMDYIDI